MHGCTQTKEQQEEHHQLPPHENVSQGRWSQEEEWHSWLKDRLNTMFVDIPKRRASYLLYDGRRQSSISAI